MNKVLLVFFFNVPKRLVKHPTCIPNYPAFFFFLTAFASGFTFILHFAPLMIMWCLYTVLSHQRWVGTYWVEVGDVYAVTLLQGKIISLFIWLFGEMIINSVSEIHVFLQSEQQRWLSLAWRHTPSAPGRWWTLLSWLQQP